MNLKIVLIVLTLKVYHYWYTFSIICTSSQDPRQNNKIRIFGDFTHLFNIFSKIFYSKEKNFEIQKQRMNRAMQKIDEILLKLPLTKYFSRYVVFKVVKK